ncbi:MAG TPA: radical SAM protein, partial [Thermoanaerobaculia bacterium]
MPHLSDTTVVYAPGMHEFRDGEIDFFLDEEKPHWLAVDERGAEILRQVDGRRPFRDLISGYAARTGVDGGKAWLHVHDFVQASLRAGFLALEPIERPAYEGRGRYLRPAALRELWLHTNNSCNLTCTHCLVNSGPGETPGLPTARFREVIEEAIALGVERFYMTGGEPFLRPDIGDLIALISEKHGRELILLTNATLFRGRRGAGLDSFPRQRVKFQVSIDGATPATNDPIRGPGTFAKALDGIELLAGLGFDVSLTTVVTRQNLRELPTLARLAADHGARSQHLMWSHRRGRAK